MCVTLFRSVKERFDKISPFRPNGGVHYLCYSKLAVVGLQLRFEMPWPWKPPVGGISGLNADHIII